MKFLFSSTVLLICSAFSFVAYANTPEQNFCMQHKGRVVQLKIKANSAKPKYVEFCYFWVEAGMSTKALRLGAHNPFSGPEANRAYRNTTNPVYNTCQWNSGRILYAEKERKERTAICIFQDGSAIDERTLDSGMGSIWNKELNYALGIW